jgi:hypothetical protein
MILMAIHIGTIINMLHYQNKKTGYIQYEIYPVFLLFTNLEIG